MRIKIVCSCFLTVKGCYGNCNLLRMAFARRLDSETMNDGKRWNEGGREMVERRGREGEKRRRRKRARRNGCKRRRRNDRKRQQSRRMGKRKERSSS